MQKRNKNQIPGAMVAQLSCELPNNLVQLVGVIGQMTAKGTSCTIDNIQKRLVPTASKSAIRFRLAALGGYRLAFTEQKGVGKNIHVHGLTDLGYALLDYRRKTKAQVKVAA